MRCFSLSDLNRIGKFNVPYGGIAYNKIYLEKKIEYISGLLIKNKLSKTEVECLDFIDFLGSKTITRDDFIFLDPPYDTEFSTYDKNEFSMKDQERLANYLINQKTCKWMLVIKNTPKIKKLYERQDIFINYFHKIYNVSFMNRNNKDTQHLIISNYSLDCKLPLF